MADIFESRSATPTPTATPFLFRAAPVPDPERLLPVAKGAEEIGAATRLPPVHRALNDLLPNPTATRPRNTTTAHGRDQYVPTEGGSHRGGIYVRGSHGGMSHIRSASGPMAPVSAGVGAPPPPISLLRALVPPSALGAPHEFVSVHKASQEVQRVSSLPELTPQFALPARKPTSSPLQPALVASTSALDLQPRPVTPVQPSTTRPPPPLASPFRARSMNDLLSEYGKGAQPAPLHAEPVHASDYPSDEIQIGQHLQPETPQPDRKEPDLFRWSKVDDLTDKMLWLAITGSDPSYIQNFLLIHRKFATPRSLILCMQRRLRFLDSEPNPDLMFAGFAQMRICRLLEAWKNQHPTDFAVPGTDGALVALLKFIMGKSHLLHMASIFIPFMDEIPQLVDPSAGWAMRADIPDEDNEDRYTLTDADDHSESGQRLSVSDDSRTSSNFATYKPTASPSSSRVRTSSLPLLFLSSQPTSLPELDPSQKLVRDLLRVSHELDFVHSRDIAQELTSMEAHLFLSIKPRDWLSHIFLSGRKDPEICLVAKMGSFANRTAEWVASMILCHDKPKSRAKQVARFVEISRFLRDMKNFSSLRSIIAGIHASMVEGDLTHENFKRHFPLPYKALLSFDVLSQQVHAHRAYRLALKNTDGARIPAVIVHVSDLLRANEGNPDWHPQDPTLLHWAKFNMLAKFVDTLVQCQEACRSSSEYNFAQAPPRVRELILFERLMDPEMQYSRVNPPLDFDPDAATRPSVVNTYISESATRRESAFFRKLFSR